MGHMLPYTCRSLIFKPSVQLADTEQHGLDITALQIYTGLEQRLLAADVLAADDIQFVPEMGIDEGSDFVTACAEQLHVRTLLFIEFICRLPEKLIHFPSQYLQRIYKSAGQGFM